MPSAPTSRRTLDREKVIRGAAEIVHAEGVQALTIQRLASALAVQPSSLYNHISGMEDLWRALALMNTRTLGERLTEAVLGRSGPGAVMALAQAYRAFVQESPALYQASLRASGTQPLPDPELQAAEEHALRAVLALMESFALCGEDAIHAVRALRSAIHGFATLEAAGGFGLQIDLDESFHRLIEILIRGMQQEE
jgi:AcrR family transcriptional regulator